MATTKPETVPVAAPAASPTPASTPAPAQPWWIPPWPVFLGAGLFSMTWWIMWLLAPEKGHDPSQLFNMLAQAIVLTAFIGGVVAAVYTTTRDSQKKNDAIADLTKTIASQAGNTPQPGA